MSLPKSDVLISRFPAEREAIQYLFRLLTSDRFREITFDHLLSRTGPESASNLALILAELTRAGILRRVIRVESPREGGGIGDYSALTDVPKRMHDWRADEEIDVTTDNLRVVYKAAGSDPHG